MSNFSRFLIASDIHGDEQDKAANKVLFDFKEVWKPDISICNGDLWNFAALRKKANEEEKRTSLREDYYAGKEWFERFQPDYFNRGNHCERLWDLREENKGPLSDFAATLIADFEVLRQSIGTRMLPYDIREGILEIGKLTVLHGFYCGINAARRSAQVWGSCVVGHGHTIQSATIEGRENRVGRMIGCLCRLNMPFMRAQPSSLLHQHGFAYGIINKKTGIYQIHQAEKVGNKWMLPSSFKEY